MIDIGGMSKQLGELKARSKESVAIFVNGCRFF